MLHIRKLFMHQCKDKAGKPATLSQFYRDQILAAQ